MFSQIYLSSFKLLLCWLRSFAAALQLEIYWVYTLSIIYFIPSWIIEDDSSISLVS